MLEKLVGKTFYCYLDEYLGCNKIDLDPGAQEKTTLSSCGILAYRKMSLGMCNALDHI